MKKVKNNENQAIFSSETSKNNKKVMIFGAFLVIFVLLAILIVYFVSNKKNNESEDAGDTPPVIKELVLEVGDAVPSAEQFATELSDYEVVIEGLDGDVLDTVGEFDVILIKDESKYFTKLIISDTTPPVVALKQITITESDELPIELFVESCIDNSNKECSYSYVDESGNEIDNIDMSVGERNIYIVATDESGNKTDIISTKLIVNKKAEDKPTTNNNTGTANKPNTNTTKPNTNNNSTSNNNAGSNQSTDKNETNNTFTCTPSKSLPSGAVWYKVWGNTPISYSDYFKWEDSVNDMQILLDATRDIMVATGNQARTDGGLVYVSCSGDAFSIYGAYLLINGYEIYHDESGKQVERQVSKGYMKADGSMVWLYKNF